MFQAMQGVGKKYYPKLWRFLAEP